jgi:hypothetical protein
MIVSGVVAIILIDQLSQIRNILTCVRLTSNIERAIGECWLLIAEEEYESIESIIDCR